MTRQATAAPGGRHYDVVVAGARCAGAATALLLARQGLRVLVADPMRRGSDTLSTHALMRAGVLQLHRWGLLDLVRRAGTPAIRTTSFHYGPESVEVRIKERDGVEALYAPRRTLLDSLLLDAAESAGAEVLVGHSLADLTRDQDGRVRGAVLHGPDRRARDVAADLVIGADGRNSRVARLLDAPVYVQAGHATASIYAYHRNIGLDGYHWFYRTGGSVGAIPTNDGETCIFASMPESRFAARRGGPDALFREVVREVSPALAERVATAGPGRGMRAFAGAKGYLRRSTGAGWALVGDAGYFKDPLTAHGLTDALRDAELLARAVAAGTEQALLGYQATRDRLVLGLFSVTDRIASFAWDLEAVKGMHLTLSREMNAEVDLLVALHGPASSREAAAVEPRFSATGAGR